MSRRLLLTFALVLGAGFARDGDRGAGCQAGGGAADLPPFLEVFAGAGVREVHVERVELPSAVGPVGGLLAVPEADEPLPAVLLVSWESGLSRFLEQTARELASIGFVALAVDGPHGTAAPAEGEALRSGALQREACLAQLAAAARWLRVRDDVAPDRIGVVGWAGGGTWAVELAANMPLQACVVCYARLDLDRSLLAGLHDTPVLGLYEQGASSLGEGRTLDSVCEVLHAAGLPHKFHVFDAPSAGFMEPSSDAFHPAAAEQAWFVLYEFLGEHVEHPHVHAGAHEHDHTHEAHGGEEHLEESEAAGGLGPVAEIADFMRAVNAPEGVRGDLIELLSRAPEDDVWTAVRSRAALVAEVAGLLHERSPPRGSAEQWEENVLEYRAAAEALVEAADQSNYAQARSALNRLSATCAACHLEHR